MFAFIQSINLNLNQMRFKYVNILYSAILLFGVQQSLQGQSFSGTDDLGRKLPLQDAVGAKKEGKQVGIFYFLWQGDSGSPTSETHWDLTKLYQDHPEVYHDFHHKNWGGGSAGAGRYYFWGEPIYGYYRGDDQWVHLKNMQLLADADVDFLVIDATNRLTYTKQVKSLLGAMKTLMDQGKKAPKIVFYTNTKSGDAMQEIYDTFYSPAVSDPQKDSWYFLDGKPLIIGLSKEAKGRDYESFFTIRESQWPNEPEKVDGWPWIEFQRPQKVYKNNRGEKEIVNVSASQHPNLDASMGGSAFYGKSGNWGRSYRNNSAGNPDKDIFYGYNIQEQWDFALKQDVPFVFITGWNEWIAGKWQRTDEHKDQAHFVDQASPEYSRDIEPTWTSGLKDNYYMQMISNIRRYKGTDEVPVIEKTKEIPAIHSWNKVKDLYVDYVGDVLHRNHPGAQTEPKVQYVNESGRNDIKNIKVSATDRVLGFYVETVNPLSTTKTDNWMTLWLNSDNNNKTGWHGYDYRVIRGNQLQKCVDGFWEDDKLLEFEEKGNALLIKVPVSDIGMSKEGYSMEFKWSDNMMKDDPLDWYVNGDAAPGGRLNLLIQVQKR
ncbi:hypothetical protein CHU00_09695 [Sphingobacterium cellulitidis]|uniref:Uncharacterized protein n=2 Tax=Sphingobacteriaceae TaxID=84566 RepID=A0A8H9G3X4_9SPHI|nr:hypothetical protein CHU00_09695 [Sphingobacterium cellulitidis]GGE33284.1 hypothetical protein GCM10011516_33700 [Sphingobacterium soli]